MSNNNGNHYFEHYAKITLVDYYIFEKDSLLVRDKPDLQSERLDYGIEVTQAILKTEARCNDLKCDVRLSLSEYESIDEEVSAGEKGFYEALRAGESLKNIRIDLIRERIADKLEKLNHNYRIFSTNALYVFAETARLEESDLEKIIAYIRASHSEHAIGYDVYFLNCINKLCIYDVHQDRIDSIRIPTSDLRGLKREAKRSTANE